MTVAKLVGQSILYFVLCTILGTAAGSGVGIFLTLLKFVDPDLIYIFSRWGFFIGMTVGVAAVFGGILIYRDENHVKKFED